MTNSKFINNGNSDINYFQLGLYVNFAYSLTVTNSLFCGQLIGHDVKSRAQITMVENNQLYDGAANAALGCRDGSTSLAIDVPNGGAATISGSQIIQGATSQNYKLVDYGEEGLAYGSNNFLVSGNSFTSTGTPNATAIYNPNCIPVQLQNNPYSGDYDDCEPVRLRGRSVIPAPSALSLPCIDGRIAFAGGSAFGLNDDRPVPRSLRPMAHSIMEVVAQGWNLSLISAEEATRTGRRDKWRDGGGRVWF